MINEKREIKVNMLGQFSIYEGETGGVVSLSGRAAKLWTLVAYLIMHRQTGATTQELIDLFWPDGDNDNPASTLQNTVSRVRTTLKNMGFQDPKRLVIYQDGYYKWAPDCQTLLDIEEFDRLAGLSKEDGQDGLKAALAAIDLYKGDFLPEASTELWCVSQNTYYHSAFLRLCSNTVERLLMAHDTENAIKICTRLVDMEPMMETFSIYLMKALTESGHPQKALDHYKQMKRLYHDTYATVPSQEMDAQRLVAEMELYGSDTAESNVRSFLKNNGDEKGAFYCNNATFHEIVTLHMRAQKRNQSKAQIMLIRIKNRKATTEQTAIYMKQMETCLIETMRSGDPFTRVGAEQYWVLLPDAGPECAASVFNRIDACKRRKYPRNSAEFDYKMMDLAAINDL